MHDDQRQQAMKQDNAPLPSSPQNNSAGAEAITGNPRPLVETELRRVLASHIDKVDYSKNH
ncbi:hypothetical protein JJO83_13690 [Halomonas aquamarina]|uniref:hypothetical protein n=1 Tax=Vreelandella aquamarina TaxID=77097 RepID=UPI002358540B|nr:hypothetical protein [Halomonas aquamarina]MDC8443735.1 hypothetical protein [Halomonas aquamarina]